MNKALTCVVHFFLYALIFYPYFLIAQISEGGKPYSFSEAFQQKIPSTTGKLVEIPALDRQKIRQEDKGAGGTSRFAAPTKVNFSLENSGHWTVLDNGDRIWQMRLHAANALGLILLYNDFYLPPGARFFTYSVDRSQVLGAYTYKSNPSNGKFLTGMIDGETTVLEYFEPKEVRGQGRINIFRVDQAYHRERIERADYEFKLHSAPPTGFDSSLPCHVNVNCAAGNEWQDEKRGIVRIMLVVEEGTGWCSGSLMNNARQDGTPYVLSAFHCDDGFTPLHDFWRFDFQYESPDCNDPGAEPVYQSLLGCKLKSGRRESDFQLLEINSAIPSNYNAYFNGWNRSAGFIPSKGTMIHHPAGDIKKISGDNDPLTIFNQSINWMETGVITPASHHFRAQLDVGTFEGGSSGSPLFDQNSRIVGQLNGGNASCSEFIAYYGRLSISWEAGGSASERLRDWLDPDDTGVETLDGFALNTGGSTFVLSGSVKTAAGNAVPGALVQCVGPIQTSVPTDENGNFLINLPTGGYTVSVQKNDYAGASLSIGDIVLLRQHMLGKATITSPYAMIGADVNSSGGLSISDLVQISQLILGVINSFPSSSSWKFIDKNFNFTNPSNPFSSNYPQLIQVLLFSDTSVHFIGTKMGDVNQSFAP